jgi:SmpA / OmlA family
MIGRFLLVVCAAATALLAACDPQRIAELEEGVSTEADVKARFGEPQQVWDGSGGARVFEYSRQPEGHRNYMITIGPDGRMSALRQVLTPQNFARVQPGMMMEDVRRLLGQSHKSTPFDIQRETHWDWRFLDGPNASDAKVFTVIFNADWRVVSTRTVRDPALDTGR